MLLAPALCPGYCLARRLRAASGRGTLLGGLLLTALASPACAQRGQPPAPRKATTAPADTTHLLSMRKTEEALRLLLRADSVQHSRVQPGMEAEAEGFVLDQTLTKPGRDFYELFVSTFQGLTGLGDYTIVLAERPARGNSSLISLHVNDTELLEMPLPTRTEQLEEAVAATVETAQGFLNEQLAQSKQLETTHPASLPGTGNKP
jgi:curli production assembly/transport component CsgE